MKPQYYYEKDPLLKGDALDGTIQAKKGGSNFRGVTWEGRKFNDVVFGILFVLMFVGMAIVNIVGFSKGNPSKLMPTSQYVNTTVMENKADFWFQDSVAT